VIGAVFYESAIVYFIILTPQSFRFLVQIFRPSLSFKTFSDSELTTFQLPQAYNKLNFSASFTEILFFFIPYNVLNIFSDIHNYIMDSQYRY
jgi:hypothetical protein